MGSACAMVPEAFRAAGGIFLPQLDFRFRRSARLLSAELPCSLFLHRVGDDPWERDYIVSLRSTRDPRVIFTGGIYGDGYTQLQQNAYLFVLPDEVGGTHPALVEAMGFGNCVLVNDTL